MLKRILLVVFILGSIALIGTGVYYIVLGSRMEVSGGLGALAFFIDGMVSIVLGLLLLGALIILKRKRIL